jgi:hypothetical protein
MKLQFRLRTLMIVVTIVCIVLAYCEAVKTRLPHPSVRATSGGSTHD